MLLITQQHPAAFEAVISVSFCIFSAPYVDPLPTIRSERAAAAAAAAVLHVAVPAVNVELAVVGYKLCWL
jgi:hypothetical protein